MFMPHNKKSQLFRDGFKGKTNERNWKLSTTTILISITNFTTLKKDLSILSTHKIKELTNEFQTKNNI